MARKGVHKDFHAALSVALYHIQEECGADVAVAFLQMNVCSVFKSLIF